MYKPENCLRAHIKYIIGSIRNKMVFEVKDFNVNKAKV